jgi:hypothetical protein
VLYTRIETIEFRQIIQGGIPVPVELRVERLLDLYNVDQVSVLVECGPFQNQVQLEVMRVPFVFGAGIGDREVVLSNEGPAYTERVHR